MAKLRHIGERTVLDGARMEMLFREFFPSLMAFSMKILGDEAAARDVVQQVFIRLWERRDTLDLGASLKSYLFTSVHNRSLNVIRDRGKFSEGQFPEPEEHLDPGRQLEVVELEGRIREVVAGLPVKCREIFEMNRFEGKKYGEIARELGISVKTVENQVSRALKILREKLARYLTILLWIAVNSLH